MQNYKQQFQNKFKDKKITVMGLGLLGRGIGYTKFLAECGADLVVTDLKTKDQLTTSLKQLSRFKNITYVLGRHRLEDFNGRDMIIKAPGVPLDSIYILEAKKNNIPVEMDVSLFAKCAPEVMIVGITGTRGKSMTTAIIYEILNANKKLLKKNIYLGGNVRGVATLPLLKKVKPGDILVCELDSWQLQGFGDAKISPHISVFTTFMPDHMNYYKNDLKKYFDDKANIFKFQNKDDVLVVLPEVKKMLPKDVKSKVIVAKQDDVRDFDFVVPGEHQRANLACAVEVAKQFDIPIHNIKQAVKKFKGVEGRLQYLRIYKGVKIYNDNNATTPEATIAGLEALGSKTIKSVVLIAGGADKGLELEKLRETIGKYCKGVVLLKGTGTEKLNINAEIVNDLKDGIRLALVNAQKGDTILFSPAFASFGMFQNEYDRNDQFVKIIKGLK
jgi:UDP-N-acetylmuramoylalanine--D-glutamate ligase